jgi:hypothetical protein
MFETACTLLDRALRGNTRRQIVSDLSSTRDFKTALLRLRDSMRSNVWKVGGAEINLGKIVRTFDTLTRADGFHVLHDWDGIADKVNADTIPVDVLHYVLERRGGGPLDPVVLAILLDYHFMHVLALLSVRIWDEGDADANLDRIDALLQLLQGADGSGQQFAADAETLILIGTSHYELQEWGYDNLLVKARTLNARHRVNVAIGHAASMGNHLRFGFEATYARDTVVMRDDNVADYPWLCFSLATVMSEYARIREGGDDAGQRQVLTEALLNGLSPDARAFVREPPRVAGPFEAERLVFAEQFRRYQPELVEAFERYRPTPQVYSPLSFFFNFSHNVVKGMVIDALLRGKPWRVTLNDLLTAAPREHAPEDSREALATTLMGYARANPHRIRGRLMPVIVYDPAAGRRAFSIALQKLRQPA